MKANDLTTVEKMVASILSLLFKYFLDNFVVDIFC